ncbi:MAG: hypothetical protein U0136_19625 [Bdellovibrionota bacterium]
MKKTSTQSTYQKKLEHYYNGLSRREREGRLDPAMNQSLEKFLTELRELCACNDSRAFSKAA